jgi:hypothetical protein
MLLSELVTCSSCRLPFLVQYSIDREGSSRTILTGCPRCKVESHVTLAEPAMVFVSRIPGDYRVSK